MAEKYKVRWKRIVNRPDLITESVMERISVNGGESTFMYCSDGKKERIRDRDLVSVEPFAAAPPAPKKEQPHDFQWFITDVLGPRINEFETKGKAFFACLIETKPELACLLREEGPDPFFDESNLLNAWVWVAERWDES